MLGIICLVLVIVIVIVLAVWKELDGYLKFIMVLASVLSVAIMLGEFARYRDTQWENRLTQEVNMGQVLVKGDENFICSIRIHYTDGKVSGAKLVEGSTVLSLAKEPVVPEPKKELEPLK